MTDITLDEWVGQVATELGLDPHVDSTAVLDLARDAAHAVMRPAAPLTTFLAGLSAGIAGGSASDQRAAIDSLTALCSRAAED